MSNGEIVWSKQFTANDMWNGSCPESAKDHSNCANQEAPDFDFAAPPVLIGDPNPNVMLVSQKSGWVYALDPEKLGQLIWQSKIGEGGTSGGIMFGSSSDGHKLYAALSDAKRLGAGIDPSTGGGLVALSIDQGKVIWQTAAPACSTQRPCSKAQTQAVSAGPGLVFSGSIDGILRAYSSLTGEILWSFDTAQSFESVNQIPTRGGSMSDGGVTVAGKCSLPIPATLTTQESCQEMHF
jgi:polyvinyl alcohol dehydrogenase (cytochrome)